MTPLVLSDLANFRAVGDPEAIHFDVVEVARAFCSASQLRWAFSGTDPIGPMSELRFDQTTFDGDVLHPQNASYANEVTCRVTLGSGQSGLFA
jgi:hypothetical protein